MREYSRRQSEVQRALEERRKEAYTRVPRLLEIDQEIASLSARKARALLLGQPASIEELREEVAALANERISLLKANGFPADYYETTEKDGTNNLFWFDQEHNLVFTIEGSLDRETMFQVAENVILVETP